MSAALIHSFPPLVGDRPRLLILGSMPGRASLDAGQYYAHPRNAFWPITARLFGFDAALDYPQRVARLTAAGVAVWDVLKACERSSSLDSDIVETSIVANDFASFLARHDTIGAVFFNGAKAEQSYRRHARPTLAAEQHALPTQRLPSTSPAHASLRFDDKLAVWRRALDARL